MENIARRSDGKARWLFQRIQEARQADALKRTEASTISRAEEASTEQAASLDGDALINRERIAWLQATGYCSGCGLRAAKSPGHAYCSECSSGRRDTEARTRRVRQSPRMKELTQGARARGINVELTEEWVQAVTALPCFYCGGAIQETSCGLDRKDPEQDYTEDNCVPCCEFCNKSKNTMSAEQWGRVIAPAVEKYGLGNVWPAKTRLPEETRQRREVAKAALAIGRGVHALARWATKAWAKAEADQIAALRAVRVASGLHPRTGLPMSEAREDARLHRNQRERAWHNDRVAERVSLGLCTVCGTNKPEANGLRCSACRRLGQKHPRSCWVCGAMFMATAKALKKTCSEPCEKRVISWRGDRKHVRMLNPSWDRWKKEMWLRLHPEHPEHATYCNQVTDASARDSA